MQESGGSSDELAKKCRHAYQRSRNNVFHSRPIDHADGASGSSCSSSFDPRLELQHLAELQERTRYRLIASRRRSLNVSASSFDEPDGLAFSNPRFSSRQSSFRCSKYVASPASNSVKAVYLLKLLFVTRILYLIVLSFLSSSSLVFLHLIGV